MPEENVYLHILNEQEARAAQSWITQLRASRTLAEGTSPDQVGRERQAARTLGLPPQIGPALPELEGQAEARRIERLTSDTPTLHRQYTDIDFMMLARDDAQTLSNIERLVRWFRPARPAEAPRRAYTDADFERLVIPPVSTRTKVDRAVRSLVAGGAFKQEGQEALGFLGSSAKQVGMGATAGLGANVFDAAGVVNEALSVPLQALGFEDNLFTRMARDARTQAERTRATIRDFTPKAESNLGKGYYSGLESLGKNLAMLPAGVATGSSNALAGMMSALVGAQAFTEARQKGLQPPAAATYAIPHAAFEFAFEKMPAAKLLEDIGAGSTLGRTIVRQLVTEIPGEQATTILQDFNDWVRLNPDKTLREFVAERPDAAAQTLVATMVGAVGQGSVAAGIGRMSGARDRAEQDAAAARQVQGVVQLIGESKLRARDPQEFARFLREVASDGGVYVDQQQLANVLNQAGIGQEQLRALAPSAADQIEAANLVPDSDVHIPLDELAALGPELAAQLVPHARIDPEAMSATDVQQFLDTEGERLQQDVERELARDTEDAGYQRQIEEVQRHFEGELAAAGRFRPEVNKAYATLLANFYVTQAQRAGMTAPQLLERYRLKVSASEAAGGNRLMQGAVDKLRAAAAKLTGGRLAQGDRAALHFAPDITTAPSVISLLQGADLSSFVHEGGHFFLEVQADLASRIMLAEAQGQQVGEGERGIVRDMQQILSWMGVQNLDTWAGMSLEERRAHHEKWARGFERYLMEGVAPSQEMQGVFSRVRSWLIQVYRTLLNLNVELSEEVRQVRGRMLASDSAIAEAEAARAMGPLFQTPEQAGMTLEEFQEYQALAAQATAAASAKLDVDMMRDMRWLSRARSKALRAAQSEAEGLRKEIEREVSREVLSQPIYRLWAMLTGRQDLVPPGTELVEVMDPARHSIRLRTSIVKEMDPTAYAELSRRGMTSEERGWHPDIVAEIDGLGFTSGQQLVRALYLADPPEVVIEGMTDQRMLETYGDITSKEALNRAADVAVHNELRARVIAAELDALNRANTVRQPRGKGTVDLMARAARDFARQVIARQKIRDVKPSRYAAAEARSSRLAMQSLSNLEEAAMHKRNALVNNAAAREAYKAADDVRRGVDYLRRMAKGDTLPAEYQDQIDALLERYDLRTTTTQKEARKRATLAEWIETQREMGIEPDIPEHLLRDAQLVGYRDLTVEEFRGLVDTVRQIEHLGRLKKKLLTAKDQREFDQGRDQIVAGILAHAGDRHADTRTPNTVLGESLVGLKKFWAAHIKAATWARIMDGGRDGGPVWEYLIRTANAAGDKEIAMRAKATQDAARLLAPVLKAGDLGGKGEHFATIGRSLNREARLAVALNWGNEGNRQRLLDGEGWTADQVRPVLESLTAADWQFVQQVWDYFESFRPEIAAKERRVMGREPEWVEAKPFMVRSADGAVLPLRGGYYPIKYDPRASERAEAHADAEAAKQQMRGAYTSATTRRSFTKARAEEVSGRPLLYSLDGFYNGVQEVIHDLSWHEFLIDANRLLRDKRVSAAMRQTYGPEVHQQFKTWLQDVAQGEQPVRNAGEAALGWIRQGVSISALGFNVMSALVQPLGITQSVTRIGAKWVGRGVAQFVGSPLETVDRVNELSVFMRTRSMTRLRELAEVRAQVKGAGKTRQTIDGTAYFLMLRAQQLVDVPTWWGAYEKAIAAGELEARAVALADQAVIDSQGGGTVKDLSAIERGGPALKLFTTFYQFFNVTLNNATAQTMTNESKAKTAADYLLLFVVPVILGALMKSVVTPGDSGDDDPEKLAKRLAGEEISFLFGLMFGVREISGAVQAATGTSQYGTDYSGPAGLRPISDLAKLGKQVHQGEADAALRRAVIRTAGEVLRLPAAQVNRSLDGAQALSEGRTENPAALVFGFEQGR